MPSQSVSSSSRPPSISTFSSDHPYTPHSVTNHSTYSSRQARTNRSKTKPPPQSGVSLGLEEEVSFGSDEDLLGDVGEIVYPSAKQYILDDGKKARDRENSGGTIMSVRGGKDKLFGGGGGAKKLAKSSLVIPQGLDVGLDDGGFSGHTSRSSVTLEREGGKKKGGGLMGALKGFGRKKDGSNAEERPGRAHVPSSTASSRSNTASSRHQSKPSLSRSDRTDSSTFDALPSSPTLKTQLTRTASTASSSLPHPLRSSLSTMSDRHFIPAVTSHQPDAVTFRLTTMLIPDFPTTPESLAAITILSCSAQRRQTISNKGSSGIEKSSSFRNLAFRSGSAPIGATPASWQSHLLVLTSFRLNAPTPPGTPTVYAFPTPNTPSIDSRQSTIAHLHLFSILQRAATKTAGAETQVEVERRLVGSGSTAKDWDEDGEGRRGALRFGLEDGVEWVCDLGSVELSQTWIKQIKDLVRDIKSEQREASSERRHVRSLHPSREFSLGTNLPSSQLTSLSAGKEGRRDVFGPSDTAPVLAEPIGADTRYAPLDFANIEQHSDQAKPESPGLLEAFPVVPSQSAQPDSYSNVVSGSAHLHRTRSFDSTRRSSPSPTALIAAPNAPSTDPQTSLRRVRSTGIKPTRKRQSWTSLSGQARFGPPVLPPPDMGLPDIPRPPPFTSTNHADPYHGESTAKSGNSGPQSGSEDVAPATPRLRSEMVPAPTPKQPLLSFGLDSPRAETYVSAAPDGLHSALPYQPHHSAHIRSETASISSLADHAQASTPQFHTPSEEVSPVFMADDGGRESMRGEMLRFPSGVSDVETSSMISSRASEAGSSVFGGGRRRKFKPKAPAVDIMAEFAASKDSLPKEDEAEINEDRPRVIRFAA